MSDDGSREREREINGIYRECNRRFEGLEKEQKEDHKKIHEIHAIITDGLKDKVVHLEKEVKWLLRLMVVTMLGVIVEVVRNVLT